MWQGRHLSTPQCLSLAASGHTHALGRTRLSYFASPRRVPQRCATARSVRVRYRRASAMSCSETAIMAANAEMPLLAIAPLLVAVNCGGEPKVTRKRGPAGGKGSDAQPGSHVWSQLGTPAVIDGSGRKARHRDRPLYRVTPTHRHCANESRPSSSPVVRSKTSMRLSATVMVSTHFTLYDGRHRTATKLWTSQPCFERWIGSRNS
jgi:hypothetical protein